MPAFAPPLKPLFAVPLGDVDGPEAAGVVVVIVEDVELGAAPVVGVAPTVKVLESRDKAGALKVSSVGMSQRTEPFVVPQQCHSPSASL